MSGLDLQFGSQIASVARSSSENVAPAPKPKTLADLLEALAKDPPSEYPMLRTSSSQFTTYLNKAPAEITIDSISEAKSGFRAHLRNRQYKENTIRSYSNYIRILLNLAKELGWWPD